MGAGTSDRRLAGDDMQHAVQKRTADEAPHPERVFTQTYQGGGPVREALMREEAERHKKAKELRLEHLKNHYER